MARQSASVDINVTGDKELRRALDRFGDRVADMDEPDDDAAEIVRTRARRRAPVVSGALRDTIRAIRVDEGIGVVAGSRRVAYARIIHEGLPSRNIEPNRFLTSALRDEQERVVDVYERHVDRQVRRLDKEV